MTTDLVSGGGPPASALLRLALVGPSWPWRGGIAATTTALAASLARRGTLAYFSVPIRQYPRLLFPGRDDRDPNACPRLPAADPCFGVLEPWSWLKVVRRVRAASPDALVVPYWTWAWAPLLALTAAAARCPCIGVVHNPADHDAGWAARRAARLVLGRCRGMLAHARSVAAALGRAYPGVPVEVHPLPAPAPYTDDRSAARAGFGIAPDGVAILYFGLIRFYKGVDVLLEAVSRLAEDSPVVLLLAGEPWGDERERLARMLADPRLKGRVIAHLAWVPEAEVGAWFTAADAAVLPYRSATGSAVAAQAIGAGLPLVASRVGGLVDVVRDGVDGLLVPPDDPEALALALTRIAGSELRTRLARGAAPTGSWDTYAAALESLARRVLCR